DPKVVERSPDSHPTRPGGAARAGARLSGHRAARSDEALGRTAGTGLLLGQLASHRLLPPAAGRARLSHRSDSQVAIAKRDLPGPRGLFTQTLSRRTADVRSQFRDGQNPVPIGSDGARAASTALGIGGGAE